ncbi:MAG TPA: hypothetical protein VFZ25_09560 [Chloroflexota bacterium]|nr:hypothetical protein [Chloroflexota bacterium]
MPTSLELPDTPTFPQLFGDIWWRRDPALQAGTGTGTIKIVEAAGRGQWAPTGLNLLTNGLNSWPEIVFRESALFLLTGVATATTVTPLNDLTATLRAYLQAGDFPNRSETGYRLELRVEEWPRSVWFVARQQIQEQPGGEAARLRQISGLDVEELAGIFGISRTAYHAWITGTAPRTGRHEHLLEVLALVEEASRRLGNQSATKTWLRSPVAPAGPTPLDLLHERDYDLFRGALLRTPTGREAIRLLQQPKHRGRTVPREELEDGLRRLRGRAWGDDPDADEPAR